MKFTELELQTILDLVGDKLGTKKGEENELFQNVYVKVAMELDDLEK